MESRVERARRRNRESQSRYKARKRGECVPLQREKHGANRLGQRTAEYASWNAMINRCECRSLVSWPHYGGRGIRVCARWRRSFMAFRSDMGPRPPGTSIDRIDNDGNYEPGNCRWATRIEQRRNMGDTMPLRMIEVHGTAMCITDAAAALGMDKGTLRNRLRKGLDIYAPVDHSLHRAWEVAGVVPAWTVETAEVIAGEQRRRAREIT